MAATIGLLVVSATSCKKKKDESPKALLSGKWKMTQAGYDDNNNNVMEASEVMSMGDSITLSMAFGGDGSGTMIVGFLGTDISQPFSWSLTNGDKTLHIKTPASAYTTASESDVAINTLTSSDLIIRDTTDLGAAGYASWTVFKKQ